MLVNNPNYKSNNVIYSKVGLLSLLLVLFLINSNNIFSADKPDFSVVTLKGDNQVKRTDATNWEKLKAGDKLFSDDQIKLADGAYLALLHTSGSPIEVSKSGNYTVKKLSSQASTHKSDVTKKFTKYLVDELKSSDDVLSSGDYRKKMKNLGAVERSIESTNSNSITAMMPLNSYSIDNSITFNWNNNENNESNLVIKNSDSKVIFEKNTKANNLTVDLNSLNLNKDECYFWFVTSGDNKSEEYCLFNINEEEINSINADLKTIEEEIGSENAALASLVKANYLSEKNINYKADQEFANAVSISNNDNYKVVYAKFLLKMGLNDKAESLLK